MIGFFSRLFGRSSSMPASPEALWMNAGEFAEFAGIDPRSACRRFGRALRRTNGAREAYMRVARSPHGGGLGGVMNEYNIAAIARDFPGAVSADELSRARAYASAPHGNGQRLAGGFHFHPGNDGGEPMPEETKDTPAADQHAAYLQELSTRVPQILRALEGLNLCEKKAVLSSALALVDVGFSLEVR